MVDTDELRGRLASVPREALIDALVELYEWGDDAARARVEAAGATGDFDGAARVVQEALTRWKGQSRFVSYRESGAFAREIGTVIDALEREVLPADPNQAFNLAETAMSAEEHIAGAVDDSDGDVGAELQRLPIVWMKAAAKLPRPPAGWADHVKKMVDHDDWSVRDRMLENAELLLSPDELRTLYERYEVELRASIKTEGEPNVSGFRSLARMEQIAIALKEPELYEKAMRTLSPAPNELQLVAVAQQYLAFGRPKRVVELLESADFDKRYSDYDRNRLLDEAYAALGNHQARMDLARRLFERTPSRESFRALFDLLPEEERPALRDEAKTRALDDTETLRAAQLLVELGSIDDAGELLLRRREALPPAFYGSLLELAQAFDSAGRIVPQVVLYRTLLLDILERGYSRAYHHAVDYFEKLVKLERQISAYPSGLEGMAEFTAALKTRHGRKRSFWDRIRG